MGLFKTFAAFAAALTAGGPGMTMRRQGGGYRNPQRGRARGDVVLPDKRDRIMRKKRKAQRCARTMQRRHAQ